MDPGHTVTWGTEHQDWEKVVPQGSSNFLYLSSFHSKLSFSNQLPFYLILSIFSCFVTFLTSSYNAVPRHAILEP